MIQSLCSYIFSMWSQLLLIISGVSQFTERFYQAKWKSEVAQSCPTLCNPMDSSIPPQSSNLPGASIHGIFQARVLEWVAISFSRGSSWPKDRTWVSHVAGRRFTVCLSHQGSLKEGYQAKRSHKPWWIKEKI